MARFGSNLLRFASDRSGNFAVMFGCAASVLALGAGFAINTVQLYTVKSSLQNALDAAVTSTARDLTTGIIAPGDADEAVLAFLEANADGQLAGDGKVMLSSLVVNRGQRTISASAHIDADIFFPLFGSSDTRRIATESAAIYSDKTIEVAMMLDITGSMSGDKIRDLKTAAANAATAFLAGQDPDHPRVRIALVPYADAVNAGDLARYVHYERDGVSDTPPAYDDIRLASTRDDVDVLPDGTRRVDRCATERKGAEQFTDSGPGTAMVNRDDRLEFCPRSAVLPLSGDLDEVLNRIDGFRASGSTAGHIGIQWSWYMLSPKWASALPDTATPRAYGDRKVAKYAILMTDGEFNTAFAGVSRRGDTTGGQATRSRSNAERLCEEMRDDGIEVFTIGFMLREANAKAVIKDCASDDTASTRHYFEAATGEELNRAYQEIARNIERLAITK
jgi:Flp pilus assembly protein TadG